MVSLLRSICFQFRQYVTQFMVPSHSCLKSMVLTGDMTPNTNEGRVFCIFFALIGMPFTLTVIADLGKFMASALSYLYKKFRKHFPKKSSGSSKLSKHFGMIPVHCFGFFWFWFNPNNYVHGSYRTVVASLCGAKKKSKWSGKDGTPQRISFSKLILPVILIFVVNITARPTAFTVARFCCDSYCVIIIMNPSSSSILPASV